MEVKYNWESVIERVSDCGEQPSRYCPMWKIEVHSNYMMTLKLCFRIRKEIAQTDILSIKCSLLDTMYTSYRLVVGSEKDNDHDTKYKEWIKHCKNGK